jgi:WD40 repeat protein
MFEDSALVGLIGTGEDFSVSQRKVFLFNMQTEEEICSFSFPTAVIALRFSQERLVFVLENEIHIHDSERLNESACVVKTFNNSKGICALSGRGQLIAYPYPHPDKVEKGTVAIFDCKNQEGYCPPITGHMEPIAALALNSPGDMLATVSTRGTTIRVFSLPDGKEQFAFRRGSSPAEVTSLSFSADSSLLVVCSDKPTIHIFRLTKVDPKNESMFAAYIPTVLSTVWDDHPRVRLPNATRSIAAISNNKRSVFVITEDGLFYSYDLDLTRGDMNMPAFRMSLALAGFLTESVTM